MFVLIFNQLLKMLLIMLVAFLCYRIHIVNQEGNRCVSNLLLMVVNPCLILTVYQMEYDPALVKGLLISFAAAAVSHFVSFTAAHFLIPARNNPEYAVERFVSVYSNCGFIGIPLINSVLGAEGVFYLTAYMTVFNILTWTHGLSLMQGNLSGKQLFQGLRTPMVIATILAIVLFFLQIRIPDTLRASMDYLADMNTPLAMMVAGVSVAQTDLKKILKKGRIYWVSFLKLLVMPLLTMIFLVAAGLDYKVAYVILIAAACPTATTTTMMAIRYNKNYTYTSEIFAISTVLSIVTIPLVTLIAGNFIH